MSLENVVVEVEAPVEVAEDVQMSDTVSVEELAGTKEAVSRDISEQLMKDAPGGEHSKMQERAMMMRYTQTRNRQITAWMDTNFTESDVELKTTMHALCAYVSGLIATLTPEEFKDHPFSKVFIGDALQLEWKAGGLNIVDVQLGFNPTTTLPYVKKQIEVFGNAVILKHPKLAKELMDAGVRLDLRVPRGGVTNVKSIIFSVGQMVEIYNTKAATIITFKTNPSQEVALKPLDIWHTLKPTGFNGMLKYMAERKFTAMGRREWADWNRVKGTAAPITDANPFLQDQTKGDDLPW